MSTRTATTELAIPFTQPSSSARQAAVAECVGCILAGQPLPAQYRSLAPTVWRPATVREGVEWVLAGGPAPDRR
jgi:hypothetical protein